MKSKISKLVIAFIISILGISFLSFTPIAHAAGDVCNQSGVPEEVRNAAGCEGTSDDLPDLIVGILNAIIAISGIIAVIFVLIGGINYMTSAGDSAKLQKAKSTILYACIGMIIAVLSFAIVNFVIVNIIGGRDSSESSQEEEEDNDDDSPNFTPNSANTPTRETK